MALRNPGRLAITTWRGLNTFSHEHEIDPDMWFDSSNMIVNSNGSAQALRSPKTFGTAIPGYDDSDSSSSVSSLYSSASLADDGPILSMDEYRRAAGHLLFVDRGGDTYSYDSA